MRGRTWKGTGKKWRTMASRRLADRRHGPSRPGRGAGGGDNHTGLRRTSECGGKLCAVRAPKRMASGRRDAPGLRRRAGRAQPTPEARQGKGGGGGGLGGCRCPEVATDPAPLSCELARRSPWAGRGGRRPAGRPGPGCVDRESSGTDPSATAARKRTIGAPARQPQPQRAERPGRG